MHDAVGVPDNSDLEPLYHLALLAEWEDATNNARPYRQSTLGKSLAEVGFIHCSFASQVQTIADAVFRGRTDVVLLTIDPSAVPSEIRVEDLDGTGHAFPHIYGELPLEAVARVEPLSPDADGRLIV